MCRLFSIAVLDFVGKALMNTHTHIIMSLPDLTGITFQSHCQETAPDGSISVKILSCLGLHPKLSFLTLHVLQALVKRLEMTTLRHNSFTNERRPTPTTPTHAMLSITVFAFCACVNYHNKPANSACRSVAENSIISHLNENISNNCAEALIVHIIHGFFRHSTPTVTTHN